VGPRRSISEILADQWLIQGDFLLVPIAGVFDFVVGNPPYYVRQELIPDALMAGYRSRYRTIYDRADIYAPLSSARWVLTLILSLRADGRTFYDLHF